MAKFLNSFGSRIEFEPVKPDVPLLVDPRAENRQSKNLQGLCICSNPTQLLPCTIVDMSGSGAKLEFSSTDLIPATLKVYVASLNLLLKCRVVWRTQTQLGVEQIT